MNYIPIIAIAATIVIGYAVISSIKKGGWKYLKQKLGLAKKTEIKEEKGTFTTSKNLRWYFHDAKKGKIRAYGFDESDNNSFFVLDERKLPILKIHEDKLKIIRLRDLVTSSGLPNEIHLEIIDEWYHESKDAEIDRLIMANHKKDEEIMHYIQTDGEKEIEKAKIKGKVNMQMYRGMRIRQGAKPKSEPKVIEYMNEDEGE
jgi:ribosomal protein S13